jgi:hypothetical protein
MVNTHTSNAEHASLRAGVTFACSLFPIVAASWLVMTLALSSWNLDLAMLALLVGSATSLLSPAGLVFAIRGYRAGPAAVNRGAVNFALVGNSLVISQVVVIAALAHWG